MALKLVASHDEPTPTGEKERPTPWWVIVLMVLGLVAWVSGRHFNADYEPRCTTWTR
jgi:hypothetical protein